MVDTYDPNRGYVPPLDPRGSVYDPIRGIMPSSPQQAWWQQYMDELGNRLGPFGAWDRTRIAMAQAQARADAAARGIPADAADPIIPPPMATGEQGYVAPVPPRGSLITPTTATDGSGVLPTLGAPGAPGSPLAGPPAPASAFGPAGPGVLPPLDRDRALPPLTTPNSMTPTPAPSMLGGNNYTASGSTYTPTEGSATQEQDALRRAGSAPSGSSGGVATGGLSGALSGLGGPTRINSEAAMALYDDESGMALRQGFQDAGINSFENPYAKRVIQRYAKILPDLMDFFAIASGINPGDTASMATWVPAFIKGFMSGEIDPDKMVRRAIELAQDSPLLKTFLTEQIGVDNLLKIQGQTSGYGPRVEAARQSVLKERLARQQMDFLKNPASDDVKASAWLDIVRGGVR
jgi:hypothetical protein